MRRRTGGRLASPRDPDPTLGVPGRRAARARRAHREPVRGRPRLPPARRRRDPRRRARIPTVDTWTFTAAGAAVGRPAVGRPGRARGRLPARAAGRGSSCSGPPSSGSSSAACSSIARRRGLGTRRAAAADARGVRRRARSRSALRPQLLGHGAASRSSCCSSPTGARTRGRLWLVPVVVAVWANLHGSFFLGPLVLGLAWLEDLHDRAAGRRTAPSSSRSSARRPPA